MYACNDCRESFRKKGSQAPCEGCEYNVPSLPARLDPIAWAFNRIFSSAWNGMGGLSIENIRSTMALHGIPNQDQAQMLDYIVMMLTEIQQQARKNG